MNRPCRSLALVLASRGFVLAAALASLASLAFAPCSGANPIGPTLIATDGAQLIDIYLMPHGTPETWTWFAAPGCRLAQADSIGVTAMDLVGTTGAVALCGARTGTSWSGTAVCTATPWTCATQTPLVDLHHSLFGLENVNGTTYGVGWADPPATPGGASLWTIDPSTGAVSEIGSLGSLLAGALVSGLAWDANAQVLYTLACCADPLGQNQDAHLARIDPASGLCTDTWPILTVTGEPMTYLDAVEWIGGDTFVAAGRNSAELYALSFVPETSPPGPGYWRATHLTSLSPGVVGGLVALAWTGWDAPYPAKTTTWGGLKARYR